MYSAVNMTHYNTTGDTGGDTYSVHKSKVNETNK